MRIERDPALQFDERGELRHLLTLEDVPGGHIEAILDAAQARADGGTAGAAGSGILANLFYEPSTRTRCSFEIAAGRLGWQVINVAEASSSQVKGESLADTVRTLAAMGVNAFAVRHGNPDAVWAAAAAAPPGVTVINAGGGSEDHPTQGLLDALTIRQAKGRVAELSIAICGDLHHSRVARSDIHAFTALGATDIRLVGPPPLLPDSPPPGCRIVDSNLEDGIRDADVIVMLRIQKERMAAATIPDTADYHARWGLTEDNLKRARPDCLVMHPGPANPGVEITAGVLEGPQSGVRTQVRNGVPVRAELLSRLTRGA